MVDSSRKRAHARTKRIALAAGALAATLLFVALAVLRLNFVEESANDLGSVDDEPSFIVNLELNGIDRVVDFVEPPRFGISAIDSPREPTETETGLPMQDADLGATVPPFRLSRDDEHVEHFFFADARLKEFLDEHAFEPGFLAGSTLSLPRVGKRPGATPEAHRAIDNAITWIVRHQLFGFWCLDHRNGMCNGRCKNPGGIAGERDAATSLALLVFLRTGQGNDSAELNLATLQCAEMLTRLMSARSDRYAGLHIPAGTFRYSDAIALVALSEAYAMMCRERPAFSNEENIAYWESRNKSGVGFCPNAIAWAAQATVNRIQNSQSPTGGWAYAAPPEPDDTIVTTCMLEALRTARAAGLRVDGNAVLRAARFLDTVAAKDARPLFYFAPGKIQVASEAKVTTAVGWLCRMSMGALPESAAVQAGADQIVKWGPQTGDKANFLYNYFATRTLHVAGGKQWDQWHAPLRDYLIATQNQDPKDHAFGSWYVDSDPGSKYGGRHYCTCLAALTLQYLCNSPSPANP
jgi:hypothetical protein